MTSPVAKAMLESYALMIMLMGSFFIYFCGMVWAFCNPKLSGAEEEEEEECGTGEPAPGHREPAAGPGAGHWVCAAPNPQERNTRCACNAAAAEGLTRTTYVNFWDDTDSLLSDCTTFYREDR